MEESLLSLQNIVLIAIIVVFIVSVILLTLILTLLVKNRVHEMGALLAMGITKATILLQLLVKVMIVGAIASFLPFGTSNFIAQMDKCVVIVTHSNDLANQADAILRLKKGELRVEIR